MGSMPLSTHSALVTLDIKDPKIMNELGVQHVAKGGFIGSSEECHMGTTFIGIPVINAFYS